MVGIEHWPTFTSASAWLHLCGTMQDQTQGTCGFIGGGHPDPRITRILVTERTHTIRRYLLRSRLFRTVLLEIH
jgi:hypothetical protein